MEHENYSETYKKKWFAASGDVDDFIFFDDYVKQNDEKDDTNISKPLKFVPIRKIMR